LLTLLSLLRFVALTPLFFVVVVLVLVLVTVVLLCPVVLLLPGVTVEEDEDLLFVTVPVDFRTGSAFVAEDWVDLLLLTVPVDLLSESDWVSDLLTVVLPDLCSCVLVLEE
jgi:hypothetical protein